MATIQDVIRMQRANRHDATYESMVALYASAAAALDPRKYARQRKRFRLGAVPWIDNQHPLTDKQLAELGKDGEFMTEQAVFLCNLDTRETEVIVHRFMGTVHVAADGKCHPDYMIVRPGKEITTIGPYSGWISNR